MIKFKNLYLWLVWCFASVCANAQTVPVGSLLQTEDALRREQLLGNDKSNSSFMLRPLFLSEDNDLSIGTEQGASYLTDWSKLIAGNRGGKLSLYALPVVWQQQYTTHHPYGINDGAIIPAKGYQTLLSAGVFAKLGPLTIQLRPEFVFAENKDYTKLSEVDNGPGFASAYKSFLRAIELPERFGDGSYSKFNWGQSSIRINAGPVSAGLSNENLWWGPGVRGSLLMSNNAPGFKHFTLNTTRPLNTPIGSFESQLIAGKLEGSGFAQTASLSIPAKSNDWRYISGFVLTYHPKWISGLYFGLDRTYIIYSKDLGKGFFDYFPVFSGVSKSNYVNSETQIDEEKQPRDQRISVFARWVMPESHAEVYFQFAKNDHNFNLRDAFVEPEHQRAYLAGVRKLIPLAAEEEFVQVGLELIQLEAGANKSIRGGGAFYSHGHVREGYTSEGQIIGAGIGSGGNIQSLDINWIRGLKRVGLQVERTVQNNTLFYQAFTDYRRHWVDLGLTGKFDWDYKNFILSSQLSYTRSLNYQYRLKPPTGFWWDWPKQDANNFQLNVGLMYRW